MAFNIDRTNGQNYSENVIDPLLLFDSGTWSVSSGTGSSTLSTVKKFVGDSSLRLENNTPASDLVATNSVQSTVIDTTDIYNISWYALKVNYLEAQDAAVLIYKNAVLIRTEEFTLGSVDPDLEQNDVWVRFQSDESVLFELGDIITFQFKLSGITTVNASTFINFDGVMLNPEGRLNKIVPLYTKPSASDVTLLTTWNMLAITSTYTSSFNDFVASDATGGAFTVTLPLVSEANKGKHIIVKKIDSTVNIVTVSGGADLIDGVSTVSLSSQYDALEVVSTAKGWYII